MQLLFGIHPIYLQHFLLFLGPLLCHLETFTVVIDAYRLFSSTQQRPLLLPYRLDIVLALVLTKLSHPTNYDSFQSVHEELEYYKNHAQELEETLAETRYTLEEFQLSSKELEEELEKEIDSTERRYNEIKIRNEAMRQEVDDWKVTIIHAASNVYFVSLLIYKVIVQFTNRKSTTKRSRSRMSTSINSAANWIL